MSNNLGRTPVTSGDSAKEATLEETLGIMDGALSAELEFEWTGSETLKTASTAQTQRALCFVFTGSTSGSPSFKFGAVQRGVVLVKNEMAVTVPISDYSGTDTINILSGQTIAVYVTQSGVSTVLESQASYTQENIEDFAAALLTSGSHTNITFTYNDSTGSIDAAVTGLMTQEDVEDYAAAMFTGGSHSGISFSYNDSTGKIDATVSGSTYTDENARDAIGAALVAGTGMTVTVNDGADTITLATTITQYTDEMARDALGAALTAGSGISITPNDGADTITIASTVTQYTDEMVDDRVAALLVAGTNITLTYDDVTGALTIDAAGGSGYTDEMARDAIGAALVAGTGISITVNDGADTITIAASGGREKLAANRTYYVDASLGSDTNTGLSAGSGNAFATIAKAVSVIYSDIDWAGYTATIQLADGTYNESVSLSGSPMNCASINIVGNTGTPANVIINGTTVVVNCSNQVTAGLSGVTLTAGSSAVGIVVTNGSVFTFGSIVFGSNVTSGMLVANNSVAVQTASTSLTFSHLSMAIGIAARVSSVVTFSSTGSIVFSGGTVAFSTCCLQCNNGAVMSSTTSGFAFSGTMSGYSLHVVRNSAVQLAGIELTALPGSGAIIQTGSSYSPGAGTGQAQGVSEAFPKITASQNQGTNDGTQTFVTNSGSDVTYTIRSNATQAMPVGTEVRLSRMGTGRAILAPGAGVTFLPSGSQEVAFQGGMIRAVKVDTDTWMISGNVRSQNIQVIAIACSDETTALTTGTAKTTFRMPYAFTLTGIKASLTTAQSAGSALTVDVNANGTTLMSSAKIVFDNTEKTTATAATPPALTTTALADDDEITIDIDTVGTSGAAGLKVYLIGYRNT